MSDGASAGRFAALRHRDFAIFWGAIVVSRVGTQMRDVALAWHIHRLTESPLALGLLGAAKVVPILLFAFGGGVTADFVDRRRLMMVTQSTLAVTSVAMALLTALGAVTPTALYALVALSSLALAFDNPARQALTVNLLPRAELENGLSLGIMGFQAATVVGPALGGLLLATLPIESLYAIDAVSFAAVLLALAAVRPRPADREPGGAASAAGGGIAAAGEALAFLRRRPLLVWLMLLDFFATFFGGAMLLMPIFATTIFGTGEVGFGLLTAAPAVGSTLASAYLSFRRPLTRYGPVILVSVLVYGASIALFGLTTWFALGLVLLAASGAADAVSTVIRQTVRQLATPDAMRGRLSGIHMIFFIGGPQLGEVEAGAVAEAYGPRASVVVGGLACLVTTGLIALFVPSLRRLTSDLSGLETPPRPGGATTV